jgi:putative membrane protein
MFDTAKRCLDKIHKSHQMKFKISISNSREITHNLDYTDLGKAGLSIFMIEILNRKYVIGWADSNNMKSGLREHIIRELEKRDVYVLDICTSDTHENSGFRTSEGYYPLGEITNFEDIANIFIQLLSTAQKNLTDAKFQILEIKTLLKVMGRNQFKDYSKALNKSMNLTKIFLGITFLNIVLMLIFTT